MQRIPKVLLVLVGAVILLFVAGAFNTTSVSATPPGQDQYCHGANQTDCRPDPQPDHGHDCDHPNGNTIGNDDHCSPCKDDCGPPPCQHDCEPPSCPDDYVPDGNGGCIPDPLDQCLNLPGIQYDVPDGMFEDANAKSVPLLMV